MELLIQMFTCTHRFVHFSKQDAMMSCPRCPWGTCWCLRVQDTGQPRHPPIQDGLPWVMSGWDGRSTASSHSGPHSNSSRVPVPSVTSLRESRRDGGGYSFRAPFIQFVERERSLGPLHRGKLTPEETGAWRAPHLTCVKAETFW